MKHSQEPLLDLVKESYDGTLQLPAFQREWKWGRGQVISLYDSIRKKFPIGSFLLLEATSEYDLSPRSYEGATKNAKNLVPVRLTLDGQQRITSGIALLYGLGSASGIRYYLDLKQLKELTESQDIDYRDDNYVQRFVQDIDDGDNYMIASTRQTEARTLLLNEHLLSSKNLINKIQAQKALEEYEEKFPDTKDFLKYVVVPYFTLDNDFNCPVITLTKEESLTAVTRIFSTINTTGKRLTPIEIVTAILFAHDIHLKKEVELYHEASEYLKNMDPDGEILLQTIALLSGLTPKKSLLPKNITDERFRLNYDKALSYIDLVGEFLTKNMGVGIAHTNSLLPYDSIVSPMAIILSRIKEMKGNEKKKAEQKTEKWFIGAALSQRYQEGVHNKQENDVREMLRWINGDNEELQPKWLKNTQITNKMKTASPSGAIGKLIKCLINKQEPIDPLEEVKVGYYRDCDEYPQEHHIWPKKFCTDHIKDWDSDNDTAELALNIIPVTSSTNQKWYKMNPSDQINDFKSTITNDYKQRDTLNRLLLSSECIKILEKQNKTKQDFYDFIDTRFRVVVERLSQWGFTLGDEPFEDDVTDE